MDLKTEIHAISSFTTTGNNVSKYSGKLDYYNNVTEMVKHDFDICSECVKKNGLIVLDDASLYNGYKPSYYSTPGHPGPSKVTLKIDPNLFREFFPQGITGFKK